MSQYIEDLQKLNQQHNQEDCFETTEDFYSTVVRGAGGEEYAPSYDLDKAKFLQEQILILQSELDIEDSDLNEILSDIVASSC